MVGYIALVPDVPARLGSTALTCFGRFTPGYRADRANLRAG